LDQVYSFTYLGAEITTDGDEMIEVDRRIAVALSAFNNISRVLTDRELSARLRVSVRQRHGWHRSLPYDGLCLFVLLIFYVSFVYLAVLLFVMFSFVL
jgi:hypothetical protein